MQEWNEQRLPKALSGYVGSTLPGRSTMEKGREEEREEEDCRETQVSTYKVWQDGLTGEEGMKQQQGMKVMKDMTRKVNEKRRISWLPRIVRLLGSMQDWKIPCRNGTTGWER